jgi:hypothetical protein
MNKTSLFASCAVWLLLSGCGSEAPREQTEQKQPKKQEEKPAEPVTGRYALHQMFTNGRGWSADIEVMRVRNIPIEGVKTEPGKAGAWEATFISPSRGRARSYTFSVVEGEGNLHKGVFAGHEESWSGPRGTNRPFIIAAVKTDTPEVLETAQKRAADYEKKNPGKPVNFILEKGTKHANPYWRAYWGESLSTSNFSILVDASTGQYLETLR